MNDIPTIPVINFNKNGRRFFCFSRPDQISNNLCTNVDKRPYYRAKFVSPVFRLVDEHNSYGRGLVTKTCNVVLEDGSNRIIEIPENTRIKIFKLTVTNDGLRAICHAADFGRFQITIDNIETDQSF